jgi:triphosphatase
MRELELKFSLPLSLQDSLARDDTGDRIERVWSCYYDTPDGALARARMAVRVRRKGDAWLQTVKADDGDRFDRFEWERPISGNVPEREALPPEDTPQGALAHRTFAQWRPLFETDFERRARVVEPAPGLRVELAQDVGEVRCAEHRESIREVELECVTGSRAAFFAWALEWARHQQACLLMPTKNERGLRLAARLPLAPPPVKAGAIAPQAGAQTPQALATVLRACISHACANLEPILASDDPEGPHQLRVALRRLRAALRFAGLREHDAAWLEIDAGARTLADAAGRVRDLDVFESGALRTLRARFRGDAAIETLGRSVIDARDAARMDLRRTLAGPATTRFVLHTLAMTEALADAGSASAPDAAAGAPLGSARFGDFAALRLHALLRRVRRRAGQARDAEGWHRTRLAVKTLRYSLEFAAEALPRGTEVARAQTILARWQERLGAGQDLASAREVAADAMSRPGVPDGAAVRALALIDGWRAFAPTDDEEPRRDARRALRGLGDALRAAEPRGTRKAGSDSAARPAGDTAGDTASDTASDTAGDTASNTASDSAGTQAGRMSEDRPGITPGDPPAKPPHDPVQ